MNSAVNSECGRYRYRLDRTVAMTGPVYGFFGVNGSKATAHEDDHTVSKWIGFSKRNDVGRFIVGNTFGYRATDVGDLASAEDPVGPENNFYLRQIIAEAEILVPCWGSRAKIPARLRPYLDELADMILAANKPVRIFGVCDSGDPLHPLRLPYTTPLVPWVR